MMNESPTNHIELTTMILSAFLRRNAIRQAELTGIIAMVYDSIKTTAASASATAPTTSLRQPAIAIERSVENDYIVCLEDGKRFKSMKRHLSRVFHMTPDQYREKWGLPSDYPMVAPAYAVTRSAIAKQAGLGQKRLKYGGRHSL